jgi:hypothetical protein
LSTCAVFLPSSIQKLYAGKHNPFAYFQNIEQGTVVGLSIFDQAQDFDGPNGLWADLQTGNAPNFSFIVPNQCHDMHNFVSGGPLFVRPLTTHETSYLMLERDTEPSVRNYVERATLPTHPAPWGWGLIANLAQARPQVGPTSSRVPRRP